MGKDLGGLYHFQPNEPIIAMTISYDLWHKRIGHPSHGRMHILSRQVSKFSLQQKTPFEMLKNVAYRYMQHFFEHCSEIRCEEVDSLCSALKTFDKVLYAVFWKRRVKLTLKHFVKCFFFF